MEKIEIERFLNKVPDEFICSICTNVLSYPDIFEVMPSWELVRAKLVKSGIT
jgi:hypothetical protein